MLSANDRQNFLTIADVAAACGASDRTVRRWVASGRLAAVKFGGLVRIRREDLDAFARPAERRHQ